MLNSTQHAFLPRFDNQKVGIGGLHGSHLVHGRGHAIIINLDAIKHHGVRATSTDACKVVVQRFERLFHMLISRFFNHIKHGGVLSLPCF